MIPTNQPPYSPLLLRARDNIPHQAPDNLGMYISPSLYPIPSQSRQCLDILLECFRVCIPEVIRYIAQYLSLICWDGMGFLGG